MDDKTRNALDRFAAKEKSRQDKARRKTRKQQEAEGNAFVEFHRLQDEVIRPTLIALAKELTQRGIAASATIIQEPKSPYEGSAIQLTELITSFNNKPVSLAFYYDNIKLCAKMYSRIRGSQRNNGSIPLSELTSERVRAEVASWLDKQ